MQIDDVQDLKESCEREPVHVPGSIQPHGVLLVVDPQTELVFQAAGDSVGLLSAKRDLLGRPLSEVLGTPLTARCANLGVGLRREPMYLGTVKARDGAGVLTVIAHMVDGWAIVELEPSPEPKAAVHMLSRLRFITEQIGDASSLQSAATIAAAEISSISGYDRAMVYQFLPDDSGSVIAESKADGLLPFLNHRFPASDIPAQARELYRRSPIRVIPDVGYTAIPLVPALVSGTGKALDMSHCALRSVSPVHIRYLKNMGVGASMSVSLLVRGRLWGLIACHNTTPALVPYEVREMCQHVAQILSQKLQAQTESREHRLAGDMAARGEALLAELVAATDPGAVIFNRCSRLQAIVHSSGAAISSKGKVVRSGRTPPPPDLDKLIEWLRERLTGGDTFVSERLPDQFPQASRFERHGSGLLCVLLPGDDPLLLMWFRAEQVEEVKWAGNPREPLGSNSRVGALSPRKSFATWRETVRGRSNPWQQVEINAISTFGRRLGFVLQQNRIRELNVLLRRANDRLTALAATDGLTGLANRRAFDDRLKAKWSSKRSRVTPLALITLDLDFFKQYNDSLGHPQGDECLRQVAKTIRQEVRAADLAARIGGEEFSILLPKTDLTGALQVAERIRAQVQALQLAHPTNSIGVATASFGVAVAIAGADQSAEKLVRAADSALYKAKAAGRNRVMSA